MYKRQVFGSVFFQKPYTGTYYAGIPEEEALYLQRIAQETVFSNPSLWNIQPTMQPEEVTRRFYPEPEQQYSTPTLSKPDVYKRQRGCPALFRGSIPCTLF